MNIFETLLRRGKLDEGRTMSDGKLLEFEKIYPLDAAYDTLDAAPEDVRASKRYADRGDFSIDGVAAKLVDDFGDHPLDIVIHSPANGFNLVGLVDFDDQLRISGILSPK